MTQISDKLKALNEENEILLENNKFNLEELYKIKDQSIIILGHL